MPAPDRVIVVGGGVAGLVAARALVLAGRDVELLERGDRLGGQLASHSVAGIELDAGPESYAVGGEALPALLRSLRLDADVVHPRAIPTWLHRADGSSVPLPASNLLGIPGVPLAQDVIDAIGFGAAFRAQLDNLMPGLVAAKARSVEEVVRRRMGRAVLDGLVAPVVRGTHGVSPDELDLDDALPGVRGALLRQGSLAGAVRSRRETASEEGLVASLRGGLHRIVAALTGDLERFGVRVRTGVEVTVADEHGVTTAAGERIDGEVLLAAPLGAPAPHTRVTVATVAVDAPELADAPRGTGVFVAEGAPGVAARALSHLSATWEWIGEATPLQLLRLTYDGEAEVTPERAHRDAEVLLGRTLPAPTDAAIVRWERAGRRADAGHAIDGMRRVGEAESGTGLATVIPYALDVVNAIPSDGDGRQD